MDPLAVLCRLMHWWKDRLVVAGDSSEESTVFCFPGRSGKEADQEGVQRSQSSR